MCGIAGILETGGQDHSAALERMCSAMAHRGPDDAGYEAIPLGSGDTRMLLGQRRLSILDLSPAGHQPMTNPRTGDWIDFNGEIYNFRELRAELEAHGQRFASTCDTEVILKGYAVWGRDVLRRLRGMFALALVDGRTGKILLARDRLGIKPLYLVRDAAPGVPLLFASEVRAILAGELVARRVSPTAVGHYLVNGCVPDPLTIIEGVESVLPGHYLLFDPAGQCEAYEPYWHPEREATGRPIAYEQARRELRERLEETVARHLISDVPLGAFLSGGVDSSALVALMARSAPGQVETFSLVFDDPELSEEAYSRAVAAAFRTRHHECRLSEGEFLSLVEPGLAALDQPTADGINSYIVSRKCREAGLVVSLAGTGGDELFGGYSSFARVPRSLRALRVLDRLPRPLARGARRGLASLFRRKNGYLPSSGARGKLAALFELPSDLLSVYHLSRMVLLPPVVAALVAGDPDEAATAALPAELSRCIRRRLAPHHDPRAQVGVCELMLYLCDQLLRDTDCVSMAVSLEVRVPLLDHVLVEQIERLPAEVRFGGGRPKGLLIDAVSDVLPRVVYDRPKKGFVLPLGRWLQGGLRPRVEALLADADAVRSAGLDPAAVRVVVADCLGAGQRVYFTRLWALFVLVDWCARNRVSSAGRLDPEPAVAC
ncbi:MAG: asparagine synthase (glutamine-hydrolyzing) [Phycisphaerae bacterium]|jgi:asparagine synthase (glutamine-hydrolysing)